LEPKLQENFFWFFLSLHWCRKTFFRFFYRFIGEKTLPYKIVSLYSIFFSKIVCQYRFNPYIFEYRCPSLAIRMAATTETLATTGTPWTLTAEKTTATRGATPAQETTGTSGRHQHQ
jgi:hypothetical protein